MERTLIAPGVHLSCDPASKFNRCRISIHFAFPAQRKTATAHALLPLVMERGYADCPDMTRLTKKLAKLYGADLTVDARPMGCNHNLCVSVTGIKDAFALEGEALTAEYTKIALGAALHPYFVDGCFDPQAVSIEKQMLKKGLEDEINDKRIYCLHQANREFFGDSPAGVRQEGYLEEVDGLTPAMLTDAYQQMLRTANIELLVLGCNAAQTAAIRDALLAELACIDRAPLPLVENMAMPTIAPVHKTENYDMVQAKLCMLFTLGQPMQPQQLAAVRLAMALYGGSVTSRLFLNVRERDHLCYYCSSSFQSFTGSMAVNSGVEHADAARAEQAILKELADLCDGPITDEELEDDLLLIRLNNNYQRSRKIYGVQAASVSADLRDESLAAAQHEVQSGWQASGIACLVKEATASADTTAPTVETAKNQVIDVRTEIVADGGTADVVMCPLRRPLRRLPALSQREGDGGRGHGRRQRQVLRPHRYPPDRGLFQGGLCSVPPQRAVGGDEL